MWFWLLLFPPSTILVVHSGPQVTNIGGFQMHPAFVEWADKFTDITTILSVNNKAWWRIWFPRLIPNVHLFNLCFRPTTETSNTLQCTGQLPPTLPHPKLSLVLWEIIYVLPNLPQNKKIVHSNYLWFLFPVYQYYNAPMYHYLRSSSLHSLERYQYFFCTLDKSIAKLLFPCNHGKQ